MLLSCQYCGQLNDIGHLRDDQAASCARCRLRLIGARSASRQVTLAVSVAALILYVPANVYPILQLHEFGMYSENTIVSGVVQLARDGFWGIATVVFVASVLVPLLKILGLMYLSLFAHMGGGHMRTRLAQVLHVIGPWSMLDVFVVAVLISLVKLGDLANVQAGPGLVAFTAVVVLTMIGAQTYDPRHLWLDEDTRRDE